MICRWARSASVQMSRPRSTPRTTIPDRYAQRFRALKQEFQQLEYFCKGTLLKRMMKCGKAQCACRQDPAKRHGPYFEWTYKAKGKTVNVKLTRDVMPMFRAASHQYRKLRSLLNRLKPCRKRSCVIRPNWPNTPTATDRKPGIFSYPTLFPHATLAHFRPTLSFCPC
jgi:hypothetical protein